MAMRSFSSFSAESLASTRDRHRVAFLGQRIQPTQKLAIQYARDVRSFLGHFQRFPPNACSILAPESSLICEDSERDGERQQNCEWFHLKHPTFTAERLRPAAQLMQNKLTDRRVEVRSG